MTDSTTLVHRETVVTALIRSQYASAKIDLVARIDGVKIEKYTAPLVTWWDVYMTDLAGDLAHAQLAELQAQLGLPLDECVVETMSSSRPSPDFPASSRVTFTRYCTAFTEVTEEVI